MNERIYKPRLGRTLSPDPVTEASENGQNYGGWQQADQYLDELDEAIRLLGEQPLMRRSRLEFAPTASMHTFFGVPLESMDIDSQPD